MKIPRYKSSGALSKGGNLPQARVNTQSSDMIQGLGADLERKGAERIQKEKRIQAETNKMIADEANERAKKEKQLQDQTNKMVSELQKLDAANSYAAKEAEIKASLEGVIEEEEITRGLDQLKVARDDSASMIKNDHERAVWSREREASIITSGVTVRNKARLEAGNRYSTGLAEYKKYIIEDSANSMDNYARNFDDFEARLAAGVENNFISQEEAGKHLREAKEQTQKRQIELSIKNNPDEMLSLIRDENNPLGINEEQKKQFETDAVAAQKNIKAERERVEKQARQANFKSFADLIASGQAVTVLPSEIDEQVNAGLLEKDDAAVIKAGIANDPTASGLMDDQIIELRRLREDINWLFSGNKKEKKKQYYEKLIELKMRGGIGVDGVNHKMSKNVFDQEMEFLMKDMDQFDVMQKSQTYMSDIIKNAISIGAFDYHQAANKVYDEIASNRSKTYGDKDIQELLAKHLPGFQEKLEQSKMSAQANTNSKQRSDSVLKLQEKWLKKADSK